MFNPKAQALADELIIVMISVRLRGYNNDTKDVNLAGIDLIVNATGEKYFGHWLAKSSSCSTLHVWIEGAACPVYPRTPSRLAE